MIFKNQGYLTITLDTEVNLASATVTRILYKNPIGGTGYFTATVTETTKLTYDFTNEDLNYVGEWRFQGYAEIGGQKAYGDIFYYTVSNPIS